MNPAPIEITPIDIDEIRAGFAWIAERVRRGHEGTQPISGKTAEKASAYIEQLEAHKAACTCEAHRPGFEVNTRNDRPYHTELALKQAGRVRAMDQAGNYDAVLATVENHRAAGLRETTDAAMRGML